MDKDVLLKLEQDAINKLNEMSDEDFWNRFGKIDRDSWHSLFENDILIDSSILYTEDSPTSKSLASVNDLKIFTSIITVNHLPMPSYNLFSMHSKLEVA